MGKVAKIEQKAASSKAAGELLDSLQHEPIRNLVSILNDRFPVPDDPGLLKSMLLTDYEMVEDPDGVPYLRIRRRLAVEIEMELARYKYPRLKASDEAGGKGGGGVKVMIVNYAAPQEPERTAIVKIIDQ